MNYQSRMAIESEALVDILLDEACRQWCDGIADAPERISGKGFSNFFRQIIEEKWDEYQDEVQFVIMKRRGNYGRKD